LAALAIILGTVAITTPSFFTAGNLLNLGQVVAILGLVTIGQTFALVGGGIDFSVGATAGLTFFVVTNISRGEDGGVPLAILVTLGMVLAVGLINSILVVQRRIPAFVATLGTSILIAGIMTAWSQGVFPYPVPPVVRRISATHVGPISGSLVILVVAAVVAALVLKRSSFGQRLYATGLNDEAAAYSGVRVGLVRSATYFVSALFAALGGLLLASYTGFADSGAGGTLHLQSVAAAVIGGVSLFGGRGGALNAVGGALLMTVVLNVGILEGLPSRSEPVVTGIVLLIGAAIYGWRGRLKR
jgi:ribose/xylose/arabinose/galactoside ABC-type transport system permease subunit